MTLPVLVLGGGGHARVVIDALQLCGAKIAGFASKDVHVEGILGVPRLGDDSAILEFDPEVVLLVNGLGSVNTRGTRCEAYVRFKDSGYRFTNVIHRSAVVARDVRQAEGVQIMAGAVIQSGAKIGENSLVNTLASVDHDCTVGAHVHIAPGVTLSGDVRVDDGAHIGTGAKIIQGVCIGAGSFVAAGAVVVRDVLPGTSVRGVPAREIGP